MNPVAMILCQVVVLGVSSWALAQWFQSRTAQAREVLAMFATLAVPTVTGLIAPDPLTAPHTLFVLSNISIMCHPLAMLRLVTLFRRVPGLLMAVAWFGTICSAVVLVRVPQPVPQGPALVMVVYFLLVEGWAGWALLNGARKSSGVSRWRMGLAGFGSITFAVLVGMAGIAVTMPSHAASFQIIFVFVSIKLILCYYLGFTPPLWLWRAWQQNELHRFLIAAQSGQLRGESGRLERLLVDAAVRSVAGLNGMLILEDLAGNRRILGMETDLQVLPLQPEEGSILEARRQGRALLVTEVDGQLSPAELALTREQGARSMVVVPVAAGHLRWGALLVFLPRGTLFPDSDLNLLQLLVDQYLNLAKADAAFEEQRRLIAQLRQANEEVVRASRHKSEFMANMSHELRTPLNAIIGFTQLQLDGTLGPPAPAHVELLQDVLSSSIHLLRMISDILDLAKVEAGKMSFAPQDVRAEAVLEDVVKTLRPLAEEKGLKLITQFEPLGPLYLDPLRLRQILLNYLSNAIKFTETGEVIVRLGPEGEDHFRLDVVDRGIGVAAEDIGRLFQEFEQLDASRAKRFSGTGLGLSLVKRLVEAQGGTVFAVSKIGEGSTFSAILPRRSRRGEVVVGAPAAPPPVETPSPLLMATQNVGAKNAG